MEEIKEKGVIFDINFTPPINWREDDIKSLGYMQIIDNPKLIFRGLKLRENKGSLTSSWKKVTKSHYHICFQKSLIWVSINLKSTTA